MRSSRHVAPVVGVLLALATAAACASPSARSTASEPASVTPSGSPVASSVVPTASAGATATRPTPTRVPSPTASKTSTASTPTRPASSASASPTVHYVVSVPLPHGCLVVSPAIVGIKVYLVQRALHLVGHKERYDSATVTAVRAFQSTHHLAVTGDVGSATWAALGTGYPFCVDRYTQQPVVGAGASPAARIEAMIAYAEHRLGTPYVWGGAGPMGFDCSGLVLQALYAGGVVVPGLDTDRHVQAEFRTTHLLYVSQLPHVPLRDRRRGDLIFYGSPITHMAIYLGGGRIVEAVRPVLRIASTFADGLAPQPYVVRPFPG